MKRVKGEAEVIARMDFEAAVATIIVHAWPRMAAKMQRLYGPSLDGKAESSRRWRVPLRAISFRKPAKPTRMARRIPGFASARATTTA
jgi:hypothetical protein